MITNPRVPPRLAFLLVFSLPAFVFVLPLCRQPSSELPRLVNALRATPERLWSNALQPILDHILVGGDERIKDHTTSPIGDGSNPETHDSGKLPIGLAEVTVGHLAKGRRSYADGVKERESNEGHFLAKKKL